ncbi:MAG: ABC transporter permease, partial [Sphaerochaetaceae bacterium]
MWTLAVKNIFRNRRRTVLSGIAILVAALIICLMLAFETGMIDDMRENVINHVIGDYRVRIKEYSENERVSPLQFYLEDVTQVMKALESVEGVEKAVPLTTIGISIWQGDNSNEAVMIGTDLKKSNFFNDKKSEILEGELPKEGEKKVAITESLAKKLNLKIGDRFTFLTKTASGGSNALGVEVSAIVYLQDSDISDSTVFIPYDVLSKTLRMKDGAIQIQVFSSGNNIEMKEKALLNSISTFKGNFEIKHWS